MADDKTTKTPEQPVTDSGPGKETPPAPPKEPEKVSVSPEPEKKTEPEVKNPQVSVYNFAEIMKEKKVEERAAAPSGEKPAPAKTEKPEKQPEAPKKAEEKRRHSVWLDDATWSKVQYHYKLDGCTTQNDFIDKAIQFYCSYLQSEYAGDFLPKILGETLEAILSMFGDRIGKLLLKQAVEQNVCNHILASDTDIDARSYQKMRGLSMDEVKRTNGRIDFEDALLSERGV